MMTGSEFSLLYTRTVYILGLDILPADQGINDPRDALENLKWQKK